MVLVNRFLKAFHSAVIKVSELKFNFMKTDYIELSNMTKARKKEYLLDYEKMHNDESIIGFKFEKPLKKFNSNGLKYSPEFLQKIGLMLVMLPIELMQNYVDGITKTMVDENPEKLRKFLVSEDNININEINATSIGNLAYLILNIKDEELKNRCKLILNTIYKDTLKLIQDSQSGIAQC